MSGFRKEFDPFETWILIHVNSATGLGEEGSAPFPTFRQLKIFDALLFSSERDCRRRGALLIRCLRCLTELVRRKLLISMGGKAHGFCQGTS